MHRTGTIVVLFVLLCGGVGVAEDFDISSALRSSFSDIALLPSRLTYYNEHDDAATASYTCCKPWQHKEIMDAIKANEVYMGKYSDTDFGDDSLMHYAWVTSVQKDFRAQVSAYSLLLEMYPDSHMADDAAWRLGQLYVKDKNYPRAIDTLEFLVHEFPHSTYADDALMALVSQYNEVDDPKAAIDALIELTERHPTSDYGARALHLLATKYFEVESYDRAIEVANDLIDRYPMTDWADDAQMMIANSLRLKGKVRAALDAYEYIVQRMYGSSHTNRAMREANNLRKRLQQRRERTRGRDYDTLAYDPGRDAKDLWERARHHENYRSYAQAIDLYREFIREFPGHDNFDDAFFRIGECYRQMKILFEDINKARGPDDLYRLSERYETATGARRMTSSADELLAIKDASSAYAVIVNDFAGSPLRDDALFKIAEAYTPYENPEAVPPDAAYTFQQLLINFPGSDHEFEAMVKLVRFYANPKNYEIAQRMYPAASRAMPDLFPPGLVNDKATFLELMRLYKRHTEHAWFEAYKHHIKYAITPPDLVQAAYYYQSALLMDRGEFARAGQLLQKLARLRSGDFAPATLYLLARCHQQVGDNQSALAVLQDLASSYPQSGLADDVAWIQQEIAHGAESIGEYAQKVAAVAGDEVGHLDCHVGENVVVFAPYAVAPLMRQYNMPNIWEQAQQVLLEWTGVPKSEKAVIYVDPNRRSSAGNPIRVSAAGVKDPPDWMLGLVQLSENAVRQATDPWLTKQPELIQGLSQFAAASLQYELVTETRDAIGSASAVKLPQEAVIKSRERALKALEEYVRVGAERQEEDLGDQVVAGMLYAILDAQGYTADQLINREPYREFFSSLKAMPTRARSMYAFGTALDRAFNGTVREQLTRWGIPVFSGYSQLAG